MSALPLYLIAGFPNPIHNLAAIELERMLRRSVRVIALPSGIDDALLYKQSTIEGLLRAAGGFALRRRKSKSQGNDIPTPSQMILLFVPAKDQESLLAAFDFFAFPVPVSLAATYENGRQRRHAPSAVRPSLKAAVESTLLAETFIRALKRRLSSVSSAEPLLLPPRNFRLSSKLSLERAFLELRRGTRTWANATPEIASKRVTGEELPHAFSGGGSARVYQDYRDIFFPCARKAEYHSLRREFGAEPSTNELRSFLKTSYRFGVPLPDGFHHDAQLGGGQRFNFTEFYCNESGRVAVSGTHVNIYPNDFVRATTKREIR